MSDSGRFEALLSHQGPLVHVDHSHRAPAPRTGKCYSIASSEEIKAFFYVQREKSEVRNADTYLLTERDCGDALKPKVSLDETKLVMGKLIRMAGQETSRAQKSLDINMGKMDRMGRKRNDYLARVDPNGGVESWLSAGGFRAFDREEATNYENDAINRLQAFLSDNYNEIDGPLFILEEP